MGTSSRRCKHCSKGGAYSFNDFCVGCWNIQIEKNVVELIKEINNKKEQL